MKRIIFALIFFVSPLVRGTPIDDVVASLDRHGLWMNGIYHPVLEPLDTPIETLADQFLAVTKRASKKIEIIERKDLAKARIGAPSGMQAIFLRCEPIRAGSPDSSPALVYYVILFRFQNPEIGWWSRIHPINIQSEPLLDVTTPATQKVAPSTSVSHL